MRARRYSTGDPGDATREDMLDISRNHMPPASDEAEGNCPESGPDAYALAVAVLGQTLADAAAEVANRRFDGFKAGMGDLGFLILGERDADGLPRHAGGGGSRVANAALCMRYPFLVPRNRWTGEQAWSVGGETDRLLFRADTEFAEGRFGAFDGTELDALPRGWKARFGLEICEDIRSLVVGSAAGEEGLSDYRIDQVKEKWGSLRWYDSGVPADAYDDMTHLIDLYETISMRTCIGCGGERRVRQVGGWVSYQCEPCRMDAMDRTILEKKVIEAHNAEVPDSEGVEDAWRIPWTERRRLERQVLDQATWPVGSVWDDRILTTHQYFPDRDEPETTETDLLGWAESRGLLAYGVAMAVDRLREEVDGDTNLPVPKGEQPATDAR